MMLSERFNYFLLFHTNSANGNRHREAAQPICKTIKERDIMCLKFPAIILITLTVICSLVYIYWPTIQYHFNLDIHSKSLPYLSQNFVGREKEMEEVSNLLDFGNSDVRIVNIYGSPGFGKSTLAIHVGHKIVKEGVTVDYVNMNDFPDKDVKTALAEKILEASQIISKNVTFERLLRWARDRYLSTLVILDNCDDLLHMKKEEFHQAVEMVVEESLNIKIILTSRKVAAFLMYFEYYKIMELSPAASCQLLERKVPSRIKLTLEEKEQIAFLTGNVPLALQIIGSILNLPASPTPRVLIDELKRELIETLSPVDLPVHKQVFTVINLSYKYLPKQLRRISCQVTIFPGSFTLSAAFAVCNSTESTNQLVGEISSTEQTKKFSAWLKSLVRNSLLEHSQRTDRYQYHQLIKEYFLLIQRRHWPNETATLLPAFHIYYSNRLDSESISFELRHDYEQPLAFLDLEQHNLEYLFENLKQMQSISNNNLDIKEFLTTAHALAQSTANANFLQLRFSMLNCCMLLNSTLFKLDKMMPHLQYYLRNQSFGIERVLDVYLTIIGRVAKCEREKHGDWEAMLIYYTRRVVIESMSAIMPSLVYVSFYDQLSYLYMQLGTEFKKNALECHWLILNRTHTHLVNCQPKYCNYYHFGRAYSEMGRYQEASIFYEEDLKDRKYVMRRITILVRLVYIYSYMDEYDKMISSIARLHDLYSDVATFPLLDLVYESHATLMFIRFYRAGELFIEAERLENRFYSGLLKLKKKAKTAFREKSKYREGSLLTTKKVLYDFFVAGNYSKPAKIGKFLIGLIKNSDSFNDTKIKLHLLVGMAKYHMGQYSEGMDHIERALVGILNMDGGFEFERSTACWYLIPRMTYLDDCYQIKWNILIFTAFTPVIIVGAGLLFILSPFPFYTYNLYEHKPDERPILSLYQLSSGTTLATTHRDVELFSSFSKWLVTIHPQLREAVSGIKTLFEQIKDLLKFPFIRFARNLLHFTVCVLFVWIKLIYAYAYLHVNILRFKFEQLWIVHYHMSRYSFYVFALEKILSSLISFRSFAHAKETIRMIRDPRFQYGEDGTPHTNFLRSWIFEDEITIVKDSDGIIILYMEVPL